MSYSSASFDASRIASEQNGFVQSFLMELSFNRVLAAVAAIPVLLWLFQLVSSDRLPVLNPKKLNELTIRGRLQDFGKRSKELFIQGRELYNKSPYRINCEWGSVVVLHPDYCNEIRNLPEMNFAIPTSDVSCHSNLAPRSTHTYGGWLTILTRISIRISQALTHSLPQMLSLKLSGRI
jgi:hypothetical protein